MPYAYLFQGIIIGDCDVGKSMILLRYTDNIFRPDYDQTIGVEFGAKVVKINDIVIRLQLWDTAGEESFIAITRSFYREVAAAIFVYDVSRRDSFDNLNNWVNEIGLHAPISVVKALVGNKVDKIEERAVLFEEAQNFANNNNMIYLETSAKIGLNIDNVFRCIASEILMKIRNGTIDSADETLGIKICKQK